MSLFERALPVILANEGGFVEDPDDPGGATNKGITQQTYVDWLRSTGDDARSVRDITDAEVAAIYASRYWLEAHCDELPWPLALAHFDAAVNHGPRRAMRMLQAVVGTATDGLWGPRTAAAVSAMDPDRLLEELLWERLKVYAETTIHRQASRKFLPGWILRTVRMRERCMAEREAA